MRLREFPSDRKDDAEIFASIQGLVPHQSEGKILLKEGKGSKEFDGEEVFRSSYSRMVSKSFRIRSVTLYRVLQQAAKTIETRNEILRRLLIPEIKEAINSTRDVADKDKLELILYSLEEWSGQTHEKSEEIDAGLIKEGYRESLCQPLVCAHLDGSRLPSDLREASHAFLRDLFRLNNIQDGQFLYSPDIVIKYWNLIATDPGSFDSEISPVLGMMKVCFFRNPTSFSLEKSESDDYYHLVEFLALERRKSRIASCRVQLRGLTEQDDFVLQEIMGIETDLYDDQMHIPFAIGIPHDLSEEGLSLLKDDVRHLSGIRASVTFPLIGSLPAFGLQFSLSLTEDKRHFVLEGAEVRKENMEEVIRVVGRKTFNLARLSFPDPSKFPQPDLEQLDSELQIILDKAEEHGIDEEVSREIALKAAILDFYESLAKLTFSLSDEIVRYLEGTQVVTITIPRVLLAYLDQVLEKKDLDDILTKALEEAGR